MMPLLSVVLCRLLKECANWKEECRECVLVKEMSFSSMLAFWEVSASGWRRVVLASVGVWAVSFVMGFDEIWGIQWLGEVYLLFKLSARLGLACACKTS
jgi:hypothetical protein